MKKSRSLRTFSLCMACLMFMASAGISLDMHFCSGKLKRASIIGKAKTCAEVFACAKKCGKIRSSCAKGGDHNNCCDNKSIDIDFDFDSGEVIQQLGSDISFSAVTTVSTGFQLFTQSKSYHLYNSYIPPPLLVEDPQVTFQTFLC